MSRLVIFLVSVSLILLIPGGPLRCNDQSMADSSQESSQESWHEIGTASAIVIVVGALATVALLAASIWGGITTSRKIERRQTEKESRRIAAAIFDEASRGYGSETNVDILARFYRLTTEEVIDVIARLSATGRIDISQSPVSEEKAYQALQLLTGELARIALERKNGYQDQMTQWSGKLNRHADLIGDAGDLSGRKLLDIAEIYRILFEGRGSTVDPEPF